jgi:prevent-host-death family protein
MITVTRTELNQQTARVLAQVEAGETVIVTDRGRPIARIVPEAVNLWDELVRAGKVTLAKNPGPVELPVGVKLDVTVQEIMDDIRGSSYDHIFTEDEGRQ